MLAGRSARRAAVLAGLAALVVVGLLLGLRGLRGDSRALDAKAPDAPAEAPAEREAQSLAPAGSDGETRARAAPPPEDAGGAAASPSPPDDAAPPATDDEPRVDFWGRVVAQDGDAPLGGARIRRRSERPANLAAPAGAARVRATSAADGLFRLRVHADGRSATNGVGLSGRRSATHLIELAGHGPALFAPDAEHAHPDRAVELPLRRAATLAARVLGADGAPPPDAAVRLEAKAYDLAVPDGAYLFEAGPTWEAPLGADGRVELELPARVPLRAAIFDAAGAEKRIGEPLTLAPGERREVTWRLGGGARLAGRLVDQDGAPCAGVELWLTRSALAGDARAGTALFYGGDVDRVQDRTRTDAEGRFAFDDVAPGWWWVGPMEERNPPEPDPRAIAALATGVEVRPGETVREVELRTWRGLAIRGSVLDPWGAPAAGESVRARSDAVGGFLEADTDEAGAFTLGPLVPAEYELRTGPFSEHAAAEPVVASAGAVGVVLRLREAGALRGVVVDAADGAPAAATVWISPRASRWRSGAGADEDGGFARGGLAPGVYDLAAATEDGRAGVVRGVEVRAGEERDGVRLELHPGARVTVLYTGPETYGSYTLYRDGVPVAFDGLHTGSSATKTVPAGALRVELSLRGEVAAERELELAPGEHGEVAFELD